MKRRLLAPAALLLGLYLQATPSLAQSNLSAQGCGSLQNAYGPFDYRTDKSKLDVVEKFHFRAEHITLNKLPNQTAAALGGDIDYTLRAFPNHHQALMSMMKFGARDKVAKVPGANYSVECYMIRAETFRPEDETVKLVYGLYLMQAARPKDAVEKLEQAANLNQNNANVDYNLGLAYFELKQYDKALARAHKAYAAGFPLPGLREKLKRAGKWQEQPQ